MIERARKEGGMVRGRILQIEGGVGGGREEWYYKGREGITKGRREGQRKEEREEEREGGKEGGTEREREGETERELGRKAEQHRKGQ